MKLQLSLRDVTVAYKRALTGEGKPTPPEVARLEADVRLAEASLGLLRVRGAAEREIEAAQARVTDVRRMLEAKKAELGV